MTNKELKSKLSSDLLKKIENSDYYIEKFNGWEATEIIVDEQSNKRFATLKKPGSKVEKISAISDGEFLSIHGDYGSFTFDELTWCANVHNLRYDDVGYQMEKLNYKCRESCNLFDDEECFNAVIKWINQYLKEIGMSETAMELLVDGIKSQPDDLENFYYDLLNTNKISKQDYDLIDSNFLNFCEDILVYTNCEDEYKSFLQQNDFVSYNYEITSDLWNAGKVIDIRYYINLLAMQICKIKLESEKK